METIHYNELDGPVPIEGICCNKHIWLADGTYDTVRQAATWTQDFGPWCPECGEPDDGDGEGMGLGHYDENLAVVRTHYRKRDGIWYDTEVLARETFDKALQAALDWWVQEPTPMPWTYDPLAPE